MKHLLALAVCYVAFAIVISSLLCDLGLNRSRDSALADGKLELAKDREADLLLIGSSRVYRHFNCEIIESELNQTFSVYNLGVDGMWPPRKDVFLDRVLENAPAIVVVELNSPHNLKGNIRAPATLRSLSLSSTSDAIKVFTETSGDVFAGMNFTASYAAAMLYKYLGIGLLRNEFFDFESKLKLKANRDIAASDSGFLSLDRELEFNADQSHRGMVSAVVLAQRQKVNLEKYVAKLGTVSATLLAKCDHLIAEAKKQDCKLVFVLSPRLGASQLKMVYPVFEQIGVGSKIDMSDPRKYPEFYDAEFSFDDGHLNEKGAAMFSVAFSNELNKLLDDQRDNKN